MRELRCNGKLHGILQDKVLEVKCGSKWCGAGPGVVVLHRFDTESGALLDTEYYKDPEREDRR